jgi:hypothetical protein
MGKVLRRGTAGLEERRLLPYGAWIRLFRRHAFIIEDLVELQAGARDDDILGLRAVCLGSEMARRTHWKLKKAP